MLPRKMLFTNQVQCPLGTWMPGTRGCESKRDSVLLEDTWIPQQGLGKLFPNSRSSHRGRCSDADELLMVINVSALRASTELPPMFAKPVVISSRPEWALVRIILCPWCPGMPPHHPWRVAFSCTSKLAERSADWLNNPCSTWHLTTWPPSGKRGWRPQCAAPLLPAAG